MNMHAPILAGEPATTSFRSASADFMLDPDPGLVRVAAADPMFAAVEAWRRARLNVNDAPDQGQAGYDPETELSLERHEVELLDAVLDATATSIYGFGSLCGFLNYTIYEVPAWKMTAAFMRSAFAVAGDVR